MKDRPTPLTQIHRLKQTRAVLLVFGAGVAILTLARTIDGDPAWAWLNFWPLGELGEILVAAGLLGIWLDLHLSRDRDRAMTENNRAVQRELLPDTVDTVLRAFAAKPADVERVATPEFLDQLATSALTLRLGDERFAREIYADVRDQAIRTPERWSDVDIDVRLSCIQEKSTAGALHTSVPVPLFEVIVTWDYTLVPSARVQKFACVSDREEFHELLDELPATSTWFLSPKTQLSPSDRSAYELLRFTVDGENQPIRRSASKTRQTYTVDLGEEVVRAGQPVKIRHTLRTVITREGHWLQLALTQPTKNMKLTLDYTDTNISTLQVTDMVSSAKQPWVSYLPHEQATKVVSLEVPGWVLPKAAVTFIWTLDDEAAAPAA